jgi:chromosome segregation ATPase
MIEDIGDLTPWQHMAHARMTTLEAARKTHAEKISEHGGVLTAMDEDVKNAQAAFRAQLAVLNSIRTTQNEQHEELVSLKTRVTAVENRLTGVEATLQKVHVGVDTILDLLSSADDEKSDGGSKN